MDTVDRAAGERAEAGEVPAEVGSDVWRAFGMAVLAFHHRVWQTAMCQCGRTVIECDVLAQARAHRLLPALPGQGR